MIATILFCLHAIAVKKRIEVKFEKFLQRQRALTKKVLPSLCPTLWGTERRSDGYLALALAR